MRVLLFTGNGGAGTTTCAAATAAQAAAAGHKTLLLALGPGDGVGDVCSVTVEREPKELAAGLYAAARPAFAAAVDADVRGVLEPALAAVPGNGHDQGDLSLLPLVPQVLELLELHSQVAAGRWDAIVIDCGPAASALATLTLPATVCRQLERLVPLPHKGLPVPLPGSTNDASPRAAAFFAARRLHGRFRELRDLLTDATTTSVRLVMTTPASAVAQARRSLTSFSLHGYTVDRLIANRVEADGADSRTAESDVRVPQRIERSFAPRPVVGVRRLQREPVGVDTLRELGQAIYREVNPLVVDVAAAPIVVERRGRSFVLSLSLPLAARSDIDLVRRDDELVVTVRDERRVVLLPSALRRCVVTGAALAAGRLAVDFEPDPDLWLRS